jgi:hypothetical protein
MISIWCITHHDSDLNVRMIHALGVPKNFIRLITKFEVEPAKLSVVATDDQVVPGWMNVHRGNPPYSRSKHFQELLLCKVIDPNIALRLRDNCQLPGNERARGREPNARTATKK